MKSLRKVYLLFFTVFLSFTFFSCRSTAFETEAAYEKPDEIVIDKEDKVYRVYQHENSINLEHGERYVFIRLYQPHYDNPFCPENFLKKCIKSVDVSPEYASHSAIAFSLDDSFYGLTSTDKKHNLTIETCTDNSTNKYMRKCNIYKSVQTTFALKVSEKEYQELKDAVEAYYNDSRTKYNVQLNVKIAGRSVGRKVFFKKSEKGFAGKPNRNPENSFQPDKFEFVCSSFIAYVLCNHVESIRDFFIEKGIDADYVVPSDLAYLPGAIKLFKTTWVDYNKAAGNCVKIYSCLAPYYHEYVASE